MDIKLNELYKSQNGIDFQENQKSIPFRKNMVNRRIEEEESYYILFSIQSGILRRNFRRNVTKK